jgi:hypothetical protein
VRERERERESERENNNNIDMDENTPEMDEAPKERRRLKLKPRSKDAGTVGGYSSTRSGKSNPFGAAKPREANLEKKGVDWKKRDEELSKRLVKLPSMSAKKEEEYAALEAELAFAKKELNEAKDEDEKQKAQEEYEKKIKEKEEFIKALMSERRERRSRSDDRRQNGGGRNGGGFSSGYRRDDRRGGGGGRSNGRFNRASTGSFDREEKDDLKIFVGSLSWGVDDMMLGETFAKEGFEVVSARVVMDRDDPTRSRGFGYVRFADARDVRKALETMEGFLVDGRPIRVDMATTRRSGGRGGGNRMRGTSTGSFSRDGSGYQRY